MKNNIMEAISIGLLKETEGARNLGQIVGERIGKHAALNRQRYRWSKDNEKSGGSEIRDKITSTGRAATREIADKIRGLKEW